MGLKEASRISYSESAQPATYTDIQTGALQRIADALELSAKDREKLERDYARMRNNRDYYRRLYETEKRSAAALRGVIKRMKAKAKEIE